MAFQVGKPPARDRSSTCSRRRRQHLEQPDAARAERDRAPVLPLDDRLRWPGERDLVRLARRHELRAHPGAVQQRHRATSACLNVRYAESIDGGKTWGISIQVTDTPTNPNYEQFGGRLVPFFGDYITVAAARRHDRCRLDRPAQHRRGARHHHGDNDGADVAGDPETGGTCTSSLDDLLRRHRRARPKHLLSTDQPIAASHALWPGPPHVGGPGLPQRRGALIALPHRCGLARVARERRSR